MPKIILVVLLRTIKATTQPTKHAKAREIIDITNNNKTPQINAATENFAVKYIITQGNQNKVVKITQFIKRTAMRDNKIMRGGIGIERSRELSLALKIML